MGDRLRDLAEAAKREKWWLWDADPARSYGPVLAFAREASPRNILTLLAERDAAAAQNQEYESAIRSLSDVLEAARQQAQTLREAITVALRAATEPPDLRGFSWTRAPEEVIEPLRAALAVPDTGKGAELVAQSPETGDVRGGEQR